MISQKALHCVLVLGLLLTLGCKEQHPTEPDGTWIKYSTQTEGEELGTLELKDSSLFIFKSSSKDHTDTNGRYSLSKDNITFEDDTCFNPGTYSYTVTKKNLTFSSISDTCQERVKVLDGTWTRKNK
ncbi:MAG: hypothetical protein DHS20C13_03460 [Thermodesulfobacteriota bacterium]|nr:MAG: hypothetical protein DHS20C13_03460 [Thermodesulfobacteriota bacterium]